MSKGYGAVQRRVLAKLAENQVDPLSELDTPPYFQSWTPLSDLANEDDRAETEATRRAVKKLAAAGVVETRKLYAVSKGYWPRADGTQPGSYRRYWQDIHGKQRWGWEYPVRLYGQPRLYVRLALPVEVAERYGKIYTRWRRDVDENMYAYVYSA
jgi:hypothetical protein